MNINHIDVYSDEIINLSIFHLLCLKVLCKCDVGHLSVVNMAQGISIKLFQTGTLKKDFHNGG